MAGGGGRGGIVARRTSISAHGYGFDLNGDITAAEGNNNSHTASRRQSTSTPASTGYQNTIVAQRPSISSAQSFSEGATHRTTRTSSTASSSFSSPTPAGAAATDVQTDAHHPPLLREGVVWQLRDDAAYFGLQLSPLLKAVLTDELVLARLRTAFLRPGPVNHYGLFANEIEDFGIPVGVDDSDELDDELNATADGLSQGSSRRRLRHKHNFHLKLPKSGETLRKEFYNAVV